MVSGELRALIEEAAQLAALREADQRRRTERRRQRPPRAVTTRAVRANKPPATGVQLGPADADLAKLQVARHVLDRKQGKSLRDAASLTLDDLHAHLLAAGAGLSRTRVRHLEQGKLSSPGGALLVAYGDFLRSRCGFTIE